MIYWAPVMTMKLLLAKILQDELARGVKSLKQFDYDSIVVRLLEQITELELKLAVREITGKNKS